MPIVSSSGRLAIDERSSLVRDGIRHTSIKCFGWTKERLDIVEPILDELEQHLATAGEYGWDSGHMKPWWQTAMLAVEQGLPKPPLPWPYRVYDRAALGQLV